MKNNQSIVTIWSFLFEEVLYELNHILILYTTDTQNYYWRECFIFLDPFSPFIINAINKPWNFAKLIWIIQKISLNQLNKLDKVFKNQARKEKTFFDKINFPSWSTKE